MGEISPKNIHVVAFENPYPPNYGGVIDVFFKLQAFHKAGVGVYLHFFTSKRFELGPLTTLCKAVYVYRKKRNPLLFFSTQPYAVAIRTSKQLRRRIQQIPAPVFFEGLQSTGVINDMDFKVPVFLRLHNNEEAYYSGLAFSEKNFLKSLVYKIEALKFKRYEKHLKKFSKIFVISSNEKNVFSEKLTTTPIHLITPFHPYSKTQKLSERGSFALFHADLTIADNQSAAAFVAQKFEHLPYKLIVAGSYCPNQLKKQIQKQDNVSFVNIENEATLKKLLAEAHLNILISFQHTGTKLKLFTALHNSRHCLINQNITDEQELQSLCFSFSKNDMFENLVHQAFETTYNNPSKRDEVLGRFTSDAQMKKLLEALD